MRSGVLQGSILGPLLYLIYINDLPGVIDHSTCHIFADDAKLIKSIYTSNDCHELQHDLLSLESWCNTWNLKLNQQKCTFLRFSRSNRASYFCQYTISGSVLKQVTSQRDLGVVVTSNLSWSSHYSKLCQKAYNALHLIKRTLPQSASIELKKQLYIALVQSHFSYCSQIWKPQLVKDILCLERVL